MRRPVVAGLLSLSPAPPSLPRGVSAAVHTTIEPPSAPSGRHSLRAQQEGS